MRRPWGELKRACVIVVALGSYAPGARGADRGTASVPGSYQAPAECPSHAAWRAALHSTVAVELASLADRLAVEIERVGGDSSAAYEGRIRQDEAAISSAERSVRGATCREVFEALTLIARLGLARLSSEPSTPAQAPLDWTLTAEDEVDLARDPSPEGVGSAREPGSLRLAGAALALWGGAARATFGVDLGLALTARWASDGLQPLLLVGAYGGRERFGVSGTSAGAELERVALQAVACPLRFPRETSIGVRPCVDVDAGVLHGSGVSVEGARGRTAPWVSTGVQIRLEWSPWGPVELGAMIGGVVALTRPRFYFAPDTTAFQSDAAAIRAGASAGVSF